MKTLKEQLNALQRIAEREGDIAVVGYYDKINLDRGTHVESIKHGIFNRVHDVSSIYIVDTEPLIDKIIILAHETGHAIDFKRNWMSNTHMWLQVDNNTNDWGVILKEKDAWRIAVNLLHRVGFEQWDKLIEWVKYGLGTYWLNLGMRFDDDHPFLAEIQDKIVGGNK